MSHAFYLQKVIEPTVRRATVKALSDRIVRDHGTNVVIVGCGISGITLASNVAYELGVPLCIVRKTDDFNNHSSYRVEFPHLVGNLSHNFIMVDDLVCEGHTAKHVMRMLYTHHGVQLNEIYTAFHSEQTSVEDVKVTALAL